MSVCPVCGWPLNGERQLKNHVQIKHRNVNFVTVTLSDEQFKMQSREVYPSGEWLPIGNFWRASDNKMFIALGQGIYAGEVDVDKLGADIADFLGLGKRVL